MKNEYLLAIIIFVFFGAFAIGSFVGERASGQHFEIDDYGDIEEIVDGDTLWVGETKVRLVGIDTPEKGEPGYQEAADFLATLCPVGSEAALDIDDEQPLDKYNRTLAIAYCKGINANKRLLEEGHAEILFIPPSEFNPENWIRK